MKQKNKGQDVEISTVSVESTLDDSLKSFRNLRPVAIPTETVYGLAAPVDNEKLIKRIFALKKRPFFDPLIVHVSSISMAKNYTHSWSLVAQELAEAFWPGPLTMVLPKTSLVPDLVTSGLETVGLRMPDNTLTLKLIETLGVGLAAPSANKFSKVSPTSAEHVREAFAQKDVTVLDGGPCRVGIESTILEIKDEHIEILRPGVISSKDIENLLGNKSIRWSRNTSVLRPKSPGQLNTHYRPSYKLITALKEVSTEELESLRQHLEVGHLEERSLNENPSLAARELYSVLRRPVKYQGGVFISIPSGTALSCSEGIINRLEKASTLVVR